MSGIHRVIGDQEDLNRINVFPVADGDTGTNLSLSLGALLDSMGNSAGTHLGGLLAKVADTLLDSSRGNSGAIVAQFFQGLSDAAGEFTQFTPRTYSEAVRLGSEYAHDALSNPREGTILSVISAYADALAAHVARHRDDEFPQLATAVLADVEQALTNTTSQLDALRKAGVVDAGAKGFVDLVLGMHQYISTGEVTPRPDVSMLLADELPVPTEGPADGYAFRYCTECIVSGEDIDRRKLREALAELGDSLVLAGTKRKARVHIHVNDPKVVFETGRRFGSVSAEKADDLQRQTHSSHDTSRRFAVVTDSAADIADADLERLDIHMVPCRIQFGQRGYLDKVSITSSEFYAELANNPAPPTTSQPAPGDFRRQFQFLASHFPDVLSINLTGAASGTYEAARSAADRVDAPGKVRVIDSRNASLGQGLLAVLAAECADAGMSIDDTLERVEALMPLTRTYAILADLSYAVRGGRVPGWAKVVADVLRLTPVIRTTDRGRLTVSSAFFGKRRRIQRFARHLARRARSIGPVAVAVGHADCPEDAAALEAELRANLEHIEKLSVTEVGTALGAHGGPGMLVVALQPFSEPQARAD